MIAQVDKYKKVEFATNSNISLFHILNCKALNRIFPRELALSWRLLLGVIGDPIFAFKIMDV